MFQSLFHSLQPHVPGTSPAECSALPSTEHHVEKVLLGHAAPRQDGASAQQCDSSHPCQALWDPDFKSSLKSDQSRVVCNVVLDRWEGSVFPRSLFVNQSIAESGSKYFSQLESQIKLLHFQSLSEEEGCVQDW